MLRRGQRSAGREAVQDLDERTLTQEVLAIYRSVVTQRDPSPQVVQAPNAVS